MFRPDHKPSGQSGGYPPTVEASGPSLECLPQLGKQPNPMIGIEQTSRFTISPQNEEHIEIQTKDL